MILLISRAGHTVNKVMDWLDFYGQRYVRFSDIDNFFNLIDIEISDEKISIRIKNEKFDIDLFDVKAVWVWHGDTRFNKLALSDVAEISKNKEVSENLRSQMLTLYGFVENYINTKAIIGHPKQDVNKLIVLRYAKEIGLDIPYTYVATNMDQLSLLVKSRKLITKSISQSPFIHDKEKNSILQGYTTVVDPDALEKIKRKSIFPSLVQEKLEKKYELRIFYLDGRCYPMAIFSQRDQQTEVDFRKYNNTRPNRMMKCSIPEELEAKIAKLMKRLNLNTGSLDIVKTKGNKYVFLEINPVGQFGFVSDHCNYELEKKIAEKLISFC